MQSRTPPTLYIPTLDGWRAVAVTFVIIYHATSPGIFDYGLFGVEIFFGISGFIITTKLLEDLSQGNPSSLGKFYVRRVFRILPPALAYLCLVKLLSKAGFLRFVSLRAIGASLIFLRNYVPIPDDVYTGHFWSLSVEEHFYLFWPALLFALGAKRARWFAAGLAMATAVWRAWDSRTGALTNLLPNVLTYQRTDRVADQLLWGCFAAFIWHSDRLRSILTRRGSGWLTTAIAAAVGFLVVSKPPLSGSFVAILVPVMLLTTIAAPGYFWGRVLELWFVRWIGRLSYSMYLWQQVFCVALFYEPHYLQVFPLNIISLLACSIMSYYVLERPMISLGRRMANRLDLNYKGETLGSSAP